MGRSHDLALARLLLTRTRLLTVTGTAGIGKTRVARRAARDLQSSYPHGVCPVDLSLVRDGSLLVQVIAQALDLRCPDAGREGSLTEYLADRHLLLFLDNCEHLAAHCAPLVGALLAAAPDLRVLATSRHQLGVYGEHILDLRPLATPDPDRLPAPDSLPRYASVQLFAERAAAASGGFPRHHDDWTAAGLLCSRLDGIPLAIELAAAWLRVLPVRQILDRLDQCTRLPARSAPTGSARHRTLHDAIDWSFQLCTPEERRMWTELCVFHGGFGLCAVEAVCSVAGPARHHALTTLAALVDKSLLIREDHPDEARYRMLETIRCYGLGRLRADGREAQTRRRHLDHYRSLVADGETDWFSPRQSAWFARLHRDQANLRSAVEFALTAPGEGEDALELVASLWSHHLGSGSLEEERHWLARALARHTAPTPERAKALWADCWLALLRGDTSTVTTRMAECLAVSEDLGHAPIRAHARQLIGLRALLLDDLSGAVASLEEALELYATAGDHGNQWTTLFLLAVACSLTGHPDAADRARQSLALCDSHGARWSRCYALWLIGLQAWLRSDTGEAVDALKDALRTEEPERNLLAVAQSLELLAWIAAADGSAGHSATLLGVVRALWRRIGIARPALGRLLRHRGACEEQLRRALGAQPLEDALRAGAEMPLARGVEAALAWEPADTSQEGGPPSPLTRRETEVVELLVQGLADKQIAARLVISPRTVEGHVQRILAKLDLSSRVQVVTWAVGLDPAGERRAAEAPPWQSA
ncbi:LuxR C-terminal-related transcriptional regulator [Streptomyces sp. PCS3-D2]|uniref:ATP-binding protein n=1 Tax=Streptomyces sp. PCS3-D2 TaxID=1460244 RepID=UPI000445288A|nr:LuxR C-terminal-related transcriptional regulator [Streptomyces sp. PCS3-D2]WKV70580.1 LuxR C-terminal-related transcriptional regulator [Streptomyces sp. PCS3-D2]